MTYNIWQPLKHLLIKFKICNLSENLFTSEINYILDDFQTGSFNLGLINPAFKAHSK